MGPFLCRYCLAMNSAGSRSLKKVSGPIDKQVYVPPLLFLLNILLPDYQRQVIIFMKNISLVVAEIISGAAFGCVDVCKVIEIKPFPLQR